MSVVLNRRIGERMTKKKAKTLGRPPIYKESMVPVPLTMPKDMRDALDTYIGDQSPPPSRSALMRAWLAERLQAEGVKS